MSHHTGNPLFTPHSHTLMTKHITSLFLVSVLLHLSFTLSTIPHTNTCIHAFLPPTHRHIHSLLPLQVFILLFFVRHSPDTHSFLPLLPSAFCLRQATHSFLRSATPSFPQPATHAFRLPATQSSLLPARHTYRHSVIRDTKSGGCRKLSVNAAPR